MSKLIDTHAHFDEFAAAGETADVISAARAADVERILAVGGNPAANRLALKSAEDYGDCVHCACGFDRDQAEEQPDPSELREQLRAERCVAVGECGLDYHYRPETAAAQKRLLELNLELALERGLPVVIHSRDADEDTLAILKHYAAACDPDRAAIGVLHCFTRGRAFAGALLDIGFHISFSGIVTFKNADSLRAVAAYIPEDRIVIETDSPYLAPEPVRGRRSNAPELLPHIAQRLAEVRAAAPEHFAAVTTRNALTFFGLDKDG